MNAAKSLKRMLDSGVSNSQLDVLKALAIALHQKQVFDLSLLYTIDYAYFKVALQLLEDWRLEQHMDTRSKLMERLFGMYPNLLMPSPTSDASQEVEGDEGQGLPVGVSSTLSATLPVHKDVQEPHMGQPTVKPPSTF